MPILLYCVTSRGVCAPESLTGVAATTVDRVDDGELTAFVSSAPEPLWLQRPLRTAAIEFHRVSKEIFKSAAIIPFRFPTTFESRRELAEHLNEQSGRYVSLLEKFRNFVQMEVRISSTNSGVVKSGTEYLKARHNSIRTATQFGAELRRGLSGMVTDWRERERKDGLRVFALISRDAMTRFESAMQATLLPEAMSVRVSGPWPVSEFIEQG